MSAAVCGEPVALSTTEIAALRLPADPGVNVTVMVQLPPAASDVPQLLLWPKLLELVPVTEMLVMASAAVPGFDSVIGSAAAAVPTSVLGKASGFGLSTAWGVGTALPVPLSATVWGEPVALSATESVAENAVADAGVNVTETVQLDSAARELPQVVVSAKSVGLAPVMEMLLMASAALPVLVSVAACAALVVPVFAVNVSEPGVSETAGAGGTVPVPLSSTVWGEPVALSETDSVAR